MILKGKAKGSIVELEYPLPYPDGQLLSVSVRVLAEEPEPGSPDAVRQAMHEPPHLASKDVDEVEKAIEEGKLPVSSESIFETQN